MVKIIGALVLAGALSACTVGKPGTPTVGGVEGGSSGALIGCLITIPIGCAPGAVVGAVILSVLPHLLTGNAVTVTPPKTGR